MKRLMILASALSLGISGAALAATGSNTTGSNTTKSATANTTTGAGQHKSAGKVRHAKLDCSKTANKNKAACRNK